MASNKHPTIRQQVYESFKLPWQRHDPLKPPLILALSVCSSKPYYHYDKVNFLQSFYVEAVSEKP